MKKIEKNLKIAAEEADLFDYAFYSITATEHSITLQGNKNIEIETKALGLGYTKVVEEDPDYDFIYFIKDNIKIALT